MYNNTSDMENKLKTEPSVSVYRTNNKLKKINLFLHNKLQNCTIDFHGFKIKS